MANIVAPITPLTARNSTRKIARFITTSISLMFAGHLLLFAFNLERAPLEMVYLPDNWDSDLYGSLINGFQMLVSEEIWVGRTLSFGCAIASVILLSNLCEAWCGDFIVGACLPAGLLFFPVSAYTFALSIPFSFMLLLSVSALWFATNPAQKGVMRNAVVPAVISGVALFLDWPGNGLAVAITLIVMATHRSALLIFFYALVLSIVAVWLSIFYDVPPGPTVMPPSLEVIAATSVGGLVMPYAMLWVGLVFSIAALGLSRPLRQRMGRALIYRSTLIIFVFGIVLTWLAAGNFTPTGQMIALNAFLALGVLACMPMVLWIRWVMPTIKSVWIWILLPVVMYSCFWVVLGPIDWAGFPYDQLSSN